MSGECRDVHSPALVGSILVGSNTQRRVLIEVSLSHLVAAPPLNIMGSKLITYFGNKEDGKDRQGRSLGRSWLQQPRRKQFLVARRCVSVGVPWSIIVAPLLFPLCVGEQAFYLLQQ